MSEEESKTPGIELQWAECLVQHISVCNKRDFSSSCTFTFIALAMHLAIALENKDTDFGRDVLQFTI